jgi:hypothetical protein
LLHQGAQFLIQQTATEINAVKRKLLHCLGELEAAMFGRSGIDPPGI